MRTRKLLQRSNKIKKLVSELGTIECVDATPDSDEMWLYTQKVASKIREILEECDAYSRLLGGEKHSDFWKGMGENHPELADKWPTLRRRRL